MKTILVVDDERHIVDLVRLYLEKEGFAVIAAADGEEALDLHARHDPDLVILDLMLPKIDGFEVCREIRRRGDTPVLMLTARDDDIDAIVGLELGADDYVTKPFNPRALVARVKAILRRTDATARGGRPIEVGTLRIDPRRREATVDGRRPRPARPGVRPARGPGPRSGRRPDPRRAARGRLGHRLPGRDPDRRRPRGGGPPRSSVTTGRPIETLRGIGYRLVPPPRIPAPAIPPRPGRPAQPCPRAVAGGSSVAFALLAIATWLAIGATLFVVLRGLHADATTARSTTWPRPSPCRRASGCRPRVTCGRSSPTSATRSRRRGTRSTSSRPTGGSWASTASAPPADAIRILRERRSRRDVRWDVPRRRRRPSRGSRWCCASPRPSDRVPSCSPLRIAPPRTRCGICWLRCRRSCFVSLVVGLPVAWLIARSVAQPLRRLSAATADLPAAAGPQRPLPLEGPTEVRDLTSRFNAMATSCVERGPGRGGPARQPAPRPAHAGHRHRGLRDGPRRRHGDRRRRRAGRAAIGEEASRLEDLVGAVGRGGAVWSRTGVRCRPEPLAVAELLAQTAERFRAGAAAQGVEIVAIGTPADLVR